MTRYPKHDFEELEKAPDYMGNKSPASVAGQGLPWDWDPRKGPDPRGGEDLRHGMEPTLSVREQLLMEGAALTGGARNAEYGEPIENLSMTGELKEVFHKHMRRYMGPAEKEAIDMVLTKLGRLGRGAVKRDTYMDAAVYMAIAYEVAIIEEHEAKERI